MFQTFDATTTPDQGPPRIAALRALMAQKGVDAVIIPRADAHQGEYVADCDARLAWLTGFTGSAGFAIITQEIAALFVDGRYQVQARVQSDAMFEIIDWPQTTAGSFLKQHLSAQAVLALDPWLHTMHEIDALKNALSKTKIEIRASENLVDQIWHDRPTAPDAPAIAHPLELSGRSSAEKREEIARELAQTGCACALLTQPDGICWLLNIRGGDIERVPILRCFALVFDDGRVDLFADSQKFQGLALDKNIRLFAPNALESHLSAQDGKILLDPTSAPWAAFQAVTQPVVGNDPTSLPKACKNTAEQAGARRAHAQDAIAMCEFLAWLDAQPARIAQGARVSEIDVVQKLESFRRASPDLRDISFDTIAGSGSNGAIVHYRVTHDSNRELALGTLLLVDSGGQYPYGTTDITRTIAIGPPDPLTKACYTRVLAGMISLSEAIFPQGVSGANLDAIARAPLWAAGQDYDHGTGHGVGSYLSVHEGPQRISKSSNDIALRPGMILSNEPGYYREGAFGIRLENLVMVQPHAQSLSHDQHRRFLSFETLTYVPFDRAMIDVEALTAGQRAWLDAYHQSCMHRLDGKLSQRAQTWLARATAPL